MVALGKVQATAEVVVGSVSMKYAYRYNAKLLEVMAGGGGAGGGREGVG